MVLLIWLSPNPSLQTHLLPLPTSLQPPWLPFFSYLRAFAHAVLPTRNALPANPGTASLQISGQMLHSLLKETFPNCLIKELSHLHPCLHHYSAFSFFIALATIWNNPICLFSVFPIRMEAPQGQGPCLPCWLLTKSPHLAQCLVHSRGSISICRISCVLG